MFSTFDRNSVTIKSCLTGPVSACRIQSMDGTWKKSKIDGGNRENSCETNCKRSRKRLWVLFDNRTVSKRTHKRLERLDRSEQSSKVYREEWLTMGFGIKTFFDGLSMQIFCSPESEHDEHRLGWLFRLIRYDFSASQSTTVISNSSDDSWMRPKMRSRWWIESEKNVLRWENFFGRKPTKSCFSQIARARALSSIVFFFSPAPVENKFTLRARSCGNQFAFAVAASSACLKRNWLELAKKRWAKQVGEETVQVKQYEIFLEFLLRRIFDCLIQRHNLHKSLLINELLKKDDLKILSSLKWFSWLETKKFVAKILSSYFSWLSDCCFPFTTTYSIWRLFQSHTNLASKLALQTIFTHSMYLR